MLNSSLNELLHDKNADEIEQIFEKAQNPQIGKTTDPTDVENMEQLSYIKAKKFVDMILQKVISLKGKTDELKKQLLSAESQEDIEKILGDNTGIIDLNFLNTLTRKDMTGNVNINPVNLRKGKDQIEGAKSEDVSGYHKGSQIIPVVLEVDGSSVGVGESFYVALIPAIGSAIRPENEDLHRAAFGIEIPEGETTIWTDVNEIPIVMVNGEAELEDLKKGALTSGNQALSKFKALSLKLNQRKTQQPEKSEEDDIKDSFYRKGNTLFEMYSRPSPLSLSLLLESDSGQIGNSDATFSISKSFKDLASKVSSAYKSVMKSFKYEDKKDDIDSLVTRLIKSELKYFNNQVIDVTNQNQRDFDWKEKEVCLRFRDYIERINEKKEIDVFKNKKNFDQNWFTFINKISNEIKQNFSFKETTKYGNGMDPTNEAQILKDVIKPLSTLIFEIMWYTCLVYEQDVSDGDNKTKILESTKTILTKQIKEILKKRSTPTQANDDHPHIFDFLIEKSAQQQSQSQSPSAAQSAPTQPAPSTAFSNNNQNLSNNNTQIAQQTSQADNLISDNESSDKIKNSLSSLSLDNFDEYKSKTDDLLAKIKDQEDVNSKHEDLDNFLALNIKTLNERYREKIAEASNAALKDTCQRLLPGDVYRDILESDAYMLKMYDESEETYRTIGIKIDPQQIYSEGYLNDYNDNMFSCFYNALYHSDKFKKYVIEKNKSQQQNSSYDIFANNKLSSLLFESNGSQQQSSQQYSPDEVQQISDEANNVANQIAIMIQQAQLDIQKLRIEEEITINAEARQEQITRNKKQYQISRITQYTSYSDLEQRIQTAIIQIMGDLEQSILNLKQDQLERQKKKVTGGSITSFASRDSTKKVVGAIIAGVAGKTALIGGSGSTILGLLSGTSSVAGALSSFSTVATTAGIAAKSGAALTALGGLASSIAIGLPVAALAGYATYKAYEAIADHANDKRARASLVTSSRNAIDRQIEQIEIDKIKSTRKNQILLLRTVLAEVCLRLKAIRENDVFKEYIQNNVEASAQAQRSTDQQRDAVVQRDELDTEENEAREQQRSDENYNIFSGHKLSKLIFEEVKKEADGISWNSIKSMLSKDKYFNQLLKNDKNNFIAGSIYTLIEDITGCGSQIKGLPAFDTKNYSKELYNQYIPKEVSVGQPMIPSSKAMRQSQSTFVGMPKTGDDSCSVMQILNILNNAGRRDLMISFLSSLSDMSGEKQYFKDGDSFNTTMNAMSSDKDLEKNVRSEAKQVAKESDKLISDIRVSLFRIKKSDYDKLLKLENMFINLDKQSETIQKTLDSLGLKVKDKVKADILPESGRKQVLDYFCEVVDDNKAEKNLTLDFVYNYMKNILQLDFVIDLGDEKQLPINEEDISTLIIFNSALILLTKTEGDEKKSSKAYKKSSQVHKYVFKDLVGKIKQLQTGDNDQHKKLSGITSKGKELKLERSFVYKRGIKNLLG